MSRWGWIVLWPALPARCLEPAPSQRYSNVQQILQDLNRRQLARDRRPLMLLGIVGPLLILLATSFFGYRSIQEARKQTEAALHEEASDSNQLAARFAARTLESEIQRYYDLVNDESSMPGFVSELETTLADSDISHSLHEIAAFSEANPNASGHAPSQRVAGFADT